jgi:hypothetical protein
VVSNRRASRSFHYYLFPPFLQQVVVRLATVATGTPIHDKIGNYGNTGSNQDLHDGINMNDSATAVDSLAYIHKLAYKQSRVDVLEYQDTVVSYIVEWERAITSRVDNGLDQVFELSAKMNHYHTKVGVLRKRMNQIEKNRKGSAQSSRSTTSSSVSTVSSTLSSANPFASSTFPAKMESKLVRNQEKLEAAWKAHEAAASTLCHVVEQVTRQGWKDLVPLVEFMIEFESIRASHDSGVFEARLEKLQRELNELVKHLQVFEEDEKKIELRRPITRVLTAPALEVPIMLTSSSDGVESDDGFEDEDEDSRDNGSETSEDSSLPKAEEATTGTTSMSSSISSRTNNSPTNNSPNKSSSNSSSNIKSKEISSSSSSNNNKGIGARWPPTRITAV